MKISLLCSSKDHPVYPLLHQWCKSYQQFHNIELVTSKKELSGGDILFLISCNEIINSDIREKYSVTLVIHASDLPRGRGWSPHIWQVLSGSNDITVSLLEAEDSVDSGSVWCKKQIKLQGHELYDEINSKLFEVELELIEFAINNINSVMPQLQNNFDATYYKKRTPDDSRIDPEKSIAEQFDLLRVSDPKRYPAFIEYRGYRYHLYLEKIRPVGREN